MSSPSWANSSYQGTRPIIQKSLVPKMFVRRVLADTHACAAATSGRGVHGSDGRVRTECDVYLEHNLNREDSTIFDGCTWRVQLAPCVPRIVTTIGETCNTSNGTSDCNERCPHLLLPPNKPRTHFTPSWNHGQVTNFSPCVIGRRVLVGMPNTHGCSYGAIFSFLVPESLRMRVAKSLHDTAALRR